MEETVKMEEEWNYIYLQDYSTLFKWPEYLVFVAVLVASLGIGVFYGCFKKNTSNEEFLMAGRSMSVFPVTLSLICSFVSAITLLGNPVEVYFYGLVFMFYSASFLPMTLALAYLYVPVFFNLQLTSAYEYFEQRFNKKTRKFFSCFAIVHMMLYMPLTVWGPSLALDQVAGFNKYLSSAIIFIVCIIYSSIGGLKAVLWSDALQAIIMLCSILTIIVLGIINVGGVAEVWEINKAAGRTDAFNFDPDPRVRLTVWSGLIGAYCMWITLFGGTQAQIQRYLSVPTLKQARKCLWLNLLGMLLVVSLCSVVGLVIFAKFHKCDPVSLDGKVVSSSDQLLPLFVMHVLSDYTGLPGLLVAGLTCGSLSSVSSCLNALPAVIVEDFVKPFKPGLSDQKLALISKLISFIGGLIAFALIFVIAAAGNILPFASLIHGTFVGPIISVFSLAMFFPFVNSLGCVLGIFPSIILTIFVGVGSIMYGGEGKLPNQKLPLRTDGCYLNKTSTYSTFYEDEFYSSRRNDWKDQEYDFLTNVFSISYLWHPLISLVSCTTFGLLFSTIIYFYRGGKLDRKVKEKYMTPVVLKLWVLLLGREKIKEWVEFEEKVEMNNSKNIYVYENAGLDLGNDSGKMKSAL